MFPKYFYPNKYHHVVIIMVVVWPRERTLLTRLSQSPVGYGIEADCIHYYFKSDQSFLFF